MIIIVISTNHNRPAPRRRLRGSSSLPARSTTWKFGKDGGFSRVISPVIGLRLAESRFTS